MVEFGRESRGGPFVVTIDDEGHGIPEESLEFIFERSDPERLIYPLGQHLGSAYRFCWQIMETYGGSISATNRRAPDGRMLGARFTVRVPAANARNLSADDAAGACDLRRPSAAGRGLGGGLAARAFGGGQSDLALRLIEAGARLVADDQTDLLRSGHAVIADRACQYSQALLKRAASAS